MADTQSIRVEEIDLNAWFDHQFEQKIAGREAAKTSMLSMMVTKEALDSGRGGLSGQGRQGRCELVYLIARGEHITR